MTLLRGAVETTREMRAHFLNDPSLPLTSTTLADWLSTSGPVDSGVQVNPWTSLHMSAVWRSVTLVSGLSAALPIHVRRRASYEELRSPLIEDPHPELTPFELWRLNYAHRLTWGNSYAQKIRNGAGQIVYLYPIRPDRVRVGRTPPSEDDPSGKVFEVVSDDGTLEALTSREIFHVPGFGYDGVCGISPIRAARQAIGLGLAAEKYGARLFGSGSLMAGILQTEQRLDDKAAVALKTRWRDKMAGLDNSHDVAVLDAGAKFQPLTMPNDDAQFIESRRFSIPEIGRFFGVPAFLLGDTDSATSWGTGLEQQATGFVKFDLHPLWLAPTEQRITKELLLPRDRYAKYVVEGLLRGDSVQRATFYNIMRQVGALSANDIRDKEDLPPVEGGDTYLQPLNMAPLGSDPANDPAANPAATDPSGDG